MWLWLFVITSCALTLAGTMIKGFFIRSMAAVAVLWTIGIAVEIFWNWRHEWAADRRAQDEPPVEAPAVAATRETFSGKAG